MKGGEERRHRDGGGGRKVRLAAAWRVRTSVEVYRMGAGPAGSETVLERAAQRAKLATRVDSWPGSGS